MTKTMMKLIEYEEGTEGYDLATFELDEETFWNLWDQEWNPLMQKLFDLDVMPVGPADWDYDKRTLSYWIATDDKQKVQTGFGYTKTVEKNATNTDTSR